MVYRGYRIESLGTYPMVKVRAGGSGTVPNALSGLFTTTTQAQQAIDSSLNSLVRKRSPKNGQKKGTASRNTV